jgi:hypothetical protein
MTATPHAHAIAPGNGTHGFAHLERHAEHHGRYQHAKRQSNEYLHRV